MSTPIHIPEPCGEDFSSMSKCSTGRHCAVCKKDLFDLRKKDLELIQSVIEKNPGACVVVHPRHLENRNRFYGIINGFESFLKRHKMTAISAILISAVLLLSGCHPRRKHTMGRLSRFDKQTITTHE